jgi:hypothetical protein
MAKKLIFFRFCLLKSEMYKENKDQEAKAASKVKEDKHGLKHHAEKYHQRNVLFICEKCDSAYSSKDQLCIHLLEHLHMKNSISEQSRSPVLMLT